MEKYKRCPICGTKNDPRSMECEECGTDLMSCPVVDDTVSGPGGPEEHHAASGQSGVRMVRICTCGEKNPAQMRKCQKCGEELSDILPVPEPETEEVHYQLEDPESGMLFRIPCGSTVIGRERELAEYLGDKLFVSRTHARLLAEDGKLYVENLSTTNFTFVNNEKIGDEKRLLEVGDELSLGGITQNHTRQKEAAYFRIGLAV